MCFVSARDAAQMGMPSEWLEVHARSSDEGLRGVWVGSHQHKDSERRYGMHEIAWRVSRLRRPKTKF